MLFKISYELYLKLLNVCLLEHLLDWIKNMKLFLMFLLSYENFTITFS